MKIHRRALHACLAFLSLFAFASAVQARDAVLVDPAPVAITSGLAGELVVKDIKRALAGRGWEVTGEQPGQIDAMLHLREHVAKIKVTYDASNVQFAYVDSTNLDFRQKSNGRKYIHRNYLGWMTYLTTDLATNMQLSLTPQ